MTLGAKHALRQEALDPPTPDPGGAFSWERRLADQHRRGDENAFAQVHRHFVAMVYNLCFRMTGRAEDAEDLTQEIFLRIYRHFGSFDGRSALKTWVYRVALNHCRTNFGRKRFFTLRLREESDDDEESVLLADRGRDPEALSLARDRSEQVHAALQRLQPKFREAVILRDLEELSYEEIAELTGVNIGTVRSRIARGREGLRQVLAQEGLAR